MNCKLSKKLRQTDAKMCKILDDELEDIDQSMPGTSSQSSEANEEVEPHFNTRIDKLDDYFLLNLFSYLSIKEKLAIERVCKRWQRLILELVNKQTGLGTTWTSDEDANCLDAKRDHNVATGDVRAAIVMTNGWFYDFTDRRSLTNLAQISKKCPNVKCFHLTHGVIDHQSLNKIIELFPDFECLHLKGNILKLTLNEAKPQAINAEWKAIGQTLGKYIYHLSIDPHYEFRMNELHLMNLVKELKVLKEFRVGTHFEREVSGKFIQHLPTTCKLFYSLGREFSYDSMQHLAKNSSEQLTHLSYFFNTIKAPDGVKLVGEKFHNLVRLKVNLSFNEVILTTPSPISQLKNLKEFALDLNPFTDSHVDDGLIWCIKDGLPTVDSLEVSRACLSMQAFSSIRYCLPNLKKLTFKTIEVQCRCQTSGFVERTDRYKCDICKQKCWTLISELQQLRELHVLGYYFRSDKPKPFHNELSELLPHFKSLRVLEIFRYDISGTKLIDNINTLIDETQKGPKDLFDLYLKSVPTDINKRWKAPKVRVFKDSFML